MERNSHSPTQNTAQLAKTSRKLYVQISQNKQTTPPVSGRQRKLTLNVPDYSKQPTSVPHGDRGSETGLFLLFCSESGDRVSRLL